MGINIYVGNLSFNSTEDQLRQMFEAYGAVTSAKIITDQFTDVPRASASSRWMIVMQE